MPMTRCCQLLIALALTIGLVTVAAAAPSPEPPASTAPSSVASAVAPSRAATPSPPASPSGVPTASRVPTPVISPATSTTGNAARTSVTSFLGQVLTWYRVTTGELTARDPTDILFSADHRQLADEILHLGFDYARARARRATQGGGWRSPAIRPRTGGGSWRRSNRAPSFSSGRSCLLWCSGQ